MLDFNPIHWFFLTQGREQGKTTRPQASEPEKFRSLMLDMQQKMLSVWIEADTSNGTGNSVARKSQILFDLFARQQSELMSRITPGFFRYPASRQYEMMNVRVQESRSSEMGLQPANIFSEAGPENIKEMVQQAAVKYNVPQILFEKLIQTESDFDPEALSPKGAMGLGQLMPATAKELGLKITDEPVKGSVWDSASNLDAAARYLSKLNQMYRDQGIDTEESWKFATGAYNAGMGNIGKAMNLLSDEDRSNWDRVAGVLPRITGTSSGETIRYVDRLRSSMA